MLIRLKPMRLPGFVVAVLLVGAAASWSRLRGDAQVPDKPDKEASGSSTSNGPGETASGPKIQVEVVRPHVGSMARSDTEPGVVEAFDFANLYVKVSGYLKVQNVDIGSVVQAGQIVAEIDAPEYIQSRDQARAEVKHAEAQLQLSESAVARARADVAAAQAGVEEKKAELTRANAYLSFRRIQFERMSHLYELKSVDERLVEENRKERDAAQMAVDATQASIRTAEKDVLAKQAKVAQANADVDNARAKVVVANALLQKAQVYVDYLKIISPYHGVITARGYHVGDFIRSPDQGRQTPLFTVARTDLMRVVTKLPERYVPYADPGDPATVELDALQGRVFHGKVSRIASSLDRADRTMRVEVDLKNTSNELRDGMFGRVTIQLTESTKELSIPSSALLKNGGESASFSVYVVRDGRAELVPVKIGRDNGIRAEVISGLRSDDQIIARPAENLTPGAAVEIETAAPAATSSKK
jgi:HlyD family secretion protein